MALHKADNKILYLYISPDWVPIGCATEHSFSDRVDLIDVLIDEWAASVPANQGYDISFTGIQVESDTTIRSYDELKLIKRAKTLIQWKIEDTITADQVTGYGFITSISESAPAGDLLTFDGSILGFGLYTKIELLSGTSSGSSLVSGAFDVGGTADIWQDATEIIFQDGTEFVF